MFCELSIAIVVLCRPRNLMFSVSGRHQFLPIYHSRAMTEPVFRDAVVFVTPPASQWLVLLSLVSMLDISMFSLHIERCTFLGIDIFFLLELPVWCSRLWSFVCCDASLYACSL